MKRPKLSNIIFFILIALMIIPQTRQPIQVLLHKGLALFSPSKVTEDSRKIISNYRWKLQKLEGSSFDFSELKGKVVVINFWATWCPPCIAEMPSLEKLYNDYGTTVEFLMVSNEDDDVIKKFLNKHNYNFPVYRPVSGTPEALMSSSIPRTFVLDKNGTIHIDKTGAANWNSNLVRSTLDRLLEN